MVNFRKLAKFALTGSLAFGLIAAAGSMKAEAAKPTTNYNFTDQTLVIQPDSSEKSSYFYIETEINGKKATERVEYIWDNSGKKPKDTTVDLSGLNYAKGVKITVYNEGDIKADGTVDAADKSTTIEVAAQKTKLKATYKPNAKSGEQITITDLTNGALKADGSGIQTAATWEYRTINATNWTNGAKLTSQAIEQYSVYGTTLIIRQTPLDKDVTTADGSTKPSTENIASKEIKLKIPKKANGPKVTVDPAKLIVTIPKNAEWRVVGSEVKANPTANSNVNIWTTKADSLDGWIPTSSVLKLNPDTFIKEIQKVNATIKVEGLDDANAKGSVDPSFLQGCTIEVRTAATEKKAASKVSYIKISTQPAVVALDTDFTIVPKYDSKKLKMTGLTVKNIKEPTLQVAVVKKSDFSTTTGNTTTANQDKDFSKVKFKTVANGKQTVIAVPESDEIIIVRTAGVKATKTAAMSLAGRISIASPTIPVKPTALSGLSLDKGTDPKTTKITLASNSDSNVSYLYKVVDKEVKELPFEAKAEGTTITPGTPVDKVSAKEGQYVVVYQFATSDTDKIVTKFACTQVGSSHIQPEPTPAP